MRAFTIFASARAKVAAVAAIGAVTVAAAAPAAIALNPQPLPPRATTVRAATTPPLIGGFLTCHEYGCY